MSNKLVIEKDGKIKIFYECDSNKNKECKKRSCGICKHTTNIKYAKNITKRRKHDAPMICKIINKLLGESPSAVISGCRLGIRSRNYKNCERCKYKTNLMWR